MAEIAPPVVDSRALRRVVDEISSGNAEPDWLRERRFDALRLFEETPMPGPTEEDWRRIDLSTVHVDGAALTGHAPKRSRTQVVTDGANLGTGLIVQNNAAIALQSLDAGLASRGLVFRDIQSAASERPELVRPRFMTDGVPASEWKLVALHGAMWTGGAFVHAPRGLHADEPLVYAVTLGRGGGATFPHALVVAERDSVVTLIEEDSSEDADGEGLVSGVVEIFAGEGSRVTYVNLQSWGRNVTNFRTVRARLAKDARLLLLNVSTGGGLNKERSEVLLEGEGARTVMLGLTLGDGRQRFDFSTLQEHSAPATVSDLLLKSALTNRADLSWYGKAHVGPAASQGEASQTNRNLLLSEGARAAPIPVLEIEAHDVARCGHAATVGPVDKDQVFYLQSRGIPVVEAEQMLVRGFFEDVLRSVPSDAIVQRAKALITAKLETWKMPG